MKPLVITRHFKRAVDGDDVVPRPVEWGKSAIYYEVSEEGYPARQIQLFESGVILAYDGKHTHDHYGWLDGNQIDSAVGVVISSKEFQMVWMRHEKALNRNGVETTGSSDF